MTRITKPLTKQISLIFALFVTFSLFIGCGDEGKILNSPETEVETRSLVLLAPGKTSDENLEVSLEPEDGGQEFVIIKEGGVFTLGDGDNAYLIFLKNIGKKKLENLKVNYKVKCILNTDIEEEKNNPKFKPEDKCNNQVIISNITEVVGDVEQKIEFTHGVEVGGDGEKVKENDAYVNLDSIEIGSERILKVVVKLNVDKEIKIKEDDKDQLEKLLPPRGTSVRNEVTVNYCRELW